MIVDGACYCGYLSFEAEIDPDTVEICNCTYCQQLASSAFRVVVPAKEGTFQLLSGEPTIFVKTAESGNQRRLAFCPKCGTAIYSGPGDERSKYFGLRAGALRQFRELVPKGQYWLRSQLPWVNEIARIPGSQTE